MNSKYFRRRKPFDFDPHPLDVGVPFSKNDTHADVHFLIKVQRLPESQLEDLFCATSTITKLNSTILTAESF